MAALAWLTGMAGWHGCIGMSGLCRYMSLDSAKSERFKFISMINMAGREVC